MGATLKFALLGALVLALVILCAKPLGHYIAAVMEGRPNFALRWGARLERWIYRLCGIDVRRGNELVEVCDRTAGFQSGGCPGGLRAAAAATMAAVQPAALFRGKCRFLVQHGGGLHDEHRLAGLFRRVDHGLPHPIGRTGGAEFPVGGDGPGGRHRTHPGFHPALCRDDRQFLGRRHSIIALCAAALIRAPRRGAHRSGRDPECTFLPRRDHDREADLRQSENGQRGQAAPG